MQIALFSHYITKTHEAELQKFFKKPLKEVRFLYITTPTNYKPYQPEWSVESENRWREIFPLLKRFDVEHAFKVDPNFNFEAYFKEFDFIFISGGNTFILSYWMKETGCDEVLRKLVKQEQVIYGGESAGTAYAYKDLEIFGIADEPEKAIDVRNQALGLIDFVVIPHWDNTEHGELMKSVKEKFDNKGVKTYTLNDEQGIFIKDSNIQVI